MKSALLLGQRDDALEQRGVVGVGVDGRGRGDFDEHHGSLYTRFFRPAGRGLATRRSRVSRRAAAPLRAISGRGPRAREAGVGEPCGGKARAGGRIPRRSVKGNRRQCQRNRRQFHPWNPNRATLRPDACLPSGGGGGVPGLAHARRRDGRRALWRCGGTHADLHDDPQLRRSRRGRPTGDRGTFGVASAAADADSSARGSPVRGPAPRPSRAPGRRRGSGGTYVSQVTQSSPSRREDGCARPVRCRHGCSDAIHRTRPGKLEPLSVLSARTDAPAPHPLRRPPAKPAARPRARVDGPDAARGRAGREAAGRRPRRGTAR